MNLIRRYSSACLDSLPSTLSSAYTTSILSLLKRCKTIRNLEQVHPHIIHKGYEQDPFLITQFLSLCIALSSDLSYPTVVFERAIQPNIYLWNTLLKGYCRHSSLVNSFSFFSRMKKSTNASLDEYTFPPLINKCANVLALRERRVLHGSIVRCGIETDVYVGSSLVDFYDKCKEIECSRNMFDIMPVRNEVSWTATLVGYLNVGEALEAKNLFNEMTNRNLASWNAMISGFIGFSDLRSARELFNEMPEKNAISYTTVINWYAKTGDMVSARMLFEQSDEKDIVSWSALISGYGQNGQPNEAIQMFYRMQCRSVKPDEFTMGLSIHRSDPQAVALFERMLKDGLVPDTTAFTVILTACSHAGLIKEGCHYFDSMVNEFSLEPSPDQYACLIDLLGRSGKLKDAYDILKSMPVKPHAGAWGALLGACNLHCDLELGEEVACRLIELEPLNAGNYVLLSDIYAAANKWLDVSLLRVKIREKGLKKIPGCSWI